MQRVLEVSQWVPKPLDEVFEFFGNASNLEAITPRQLQFKILTPQPIEMGVGLLIDYQLLLGGVPMKWRSLISEWNPPHCFVDEQIKGPYLRWHHTHSFAEERGGTRISDRVEFIVPGFFLEPLIYKFAIQGQLKKIFDYRRTFIEQKFGM